MKICGKLYKIWEGKIPAQPHTTLCIQFLDRENNDKNNKLPLGKQICFTIVWGYAETLPMRELELVNFLRRHVRSQKVIDRIDRGLCSFTYSMTGWVFRFLGKSQEKTAGFNLNGLKHHWSWINSQLDIGTLMTSFDDFEKHKTAL